MDCSWEVVHVDFDHVYRQSLIVNVNLGAEAFHGWVSLVEDYLNGAPLKVERGEKVDWEFYSLRGVVERKKW
jgi:hypothetical protein